MKRGLIRGGTGVLGRAIAWRLIKAGWAVDVTGRDGRRMPADLAEAGVRFFPSERRDSTALATVIGSGADLLVDGVCFTAGDARLLIPHLTDVTSTVMLSSKAVYVDAAGNHVNSDVAPRFEAPITENGPAMAPGQSPWRRCWACPGMDVREAGPRQAPCGVPGPCWLGRRPHHGCGEHRRPCGMRFVQARRAHSQQCRPGCPECPSDRADNRPASRSPMG